MQFQVPQFIEVEDKIFGPFTFRQFIYLIGGAGIAFLAYRSLPFFIGVPIGAAALGLGAALAFFKYNSQPFVQALEYGFFFFIRSKLYLWDSEKKQRTKKKEDVVAKISPLSIPKLSDSKLSRLAWSLDIKERLEDAGASDDEITGNKPEANRNRVSVIQTARDARINPYA